MCLVATAQGRLLRAKDLAEAARGFTGRGDLGQSPQSSVAYLAAGALHAAQGEFEAAGEELTCALRLRRKAPGISPWPTLEALLLLAGVRLRLGDPSAGALLDEAQDLLAALPDGADAQLARLRRLGQELAGRSGGSPAEALTEREATVLRLLRGTLSSREIGQQLHLSPNTIKTHTRVIYRKLGVSTRLEAIQQGRRMGLF
jgi:LuxR family transcriptional regulator, maltose regulon positive regulatory protein